MMYLQPFQPKRWPLHHVPGSTAPCHFGTSAGRRRPMDAGCPTWEKWVMRPSWEKADLWVMQLTQKSAKRWSRCQIWLNARSAEISIHYPMSLRLIRFFNFGLCWSLEKSQILQGKTAIERHRKTPSETLTEFSKITPLWSRNPKDV